MKSTIWKCDPGVVSIMTFLTLVIALFMLLAATLTINRQIRRESLIVWNTLIERLIWHLGMSKHQLHHNSMIFGRKILERQLNYIFASITQPNAFNSNVLTRTSLPKQSKKQTNRKFKFKNKKQNIPFSTLKLFRFPDLYQAGGS